jgi:hypothetical protein
MDFDSGAFRTHLKFCKHVVGVISPGGLAVLVDGLDTRPAGIEQITACVARRQVKKGRRNGISDDVWRKTKKR